MKNIYIYGDETKFSNYKAALAGCGANAVFGTELTIPGGCCGLLLAGGGDLAPALYGQENTSSFDIDPKRDQDEIALLHIFSDAGLPVLGICRGIQVINVAFSGTLLQDVEFPQTHKHSPETGDSVHAIRCPKDSFLYAIYGGEFFVNSAHHQAPGIPAPGFHVAAAAPDGVIEALAMPEKDIYGVQFHPERMSFAHKRKDCVDGKAIFDFFCSRCGKEK